LILAYFEAEIQLYVGAGAIQCLVQAPNDKYLMSFCTALSETVNITAGECDWRLWHVVRPRRFIFHPRWTAGVQA